MASGSLRAAARSVLGEMRSAGTFKAERVLLGEQKAAIDILDAATGKRRRVLNFCANNYLGLANSPALAKAAKAAIDDYGYGLASVRFICGTTDLHRKLERKLAGFHGMEDAILFAACFDANAATFEALLTKEDAVISDSLNHASIIDGVRLSKAKRYIYQHADMNQLEDRLKASIADGSRNRLIATDGVFSMDGTIAPLADICSLASKYGAQVFVDDCHGTAAIGATGRGAIEACNVEGKVDIINSTLGKGLGGGMGGYTVAHQELIDMLRQKGRPYLFSNSLPPAIVGASLAALEIVESSTALRARLEANTSRFRKRMLEAGFTLKEGSHPIVPVMLHDARLAADFADDMLKRNIYVIGFSYPVVPMGQARVRVQLSAAHSREDVDRAVDAFIAVGKSRGVIS